MSARWNRMRRAAAVAFTAVSGILVGCRAEGTEESQGDVVIERVSDPLRVVEIDLGRAIGPDNRVIEPTDEFRITDTIYASVVMLGRANAATLKARWTGESGEVIDETIRTVTPVGETIAEFHLVQPAGWQKGKYRVEILLDDATVGREEFEVT
jgi:hypothetical protein